MLQVQVPLAGMPVTLILLSNGMLVFVKMTEGVGIIDQKEAGITAYFCNDGILFTDGMGNSDDIDYNIMYDYKQYPLMTKWIQQQDLQNPFKEQ